MGERGESRGMARRNLLKGVAVVSGAAAAAAAPVAVTPAAAAESTAAKTKSRYQASSKDVQSFYKTNRY